MTDPTWQYRCRCHYEGGSHLSGKVGSDFAPIPPAAKRDDSRYKWLKCNLLTLVSTSSRGGDSPELSGRPRKCQDTCSPEESVPDMRKLYVPYTRKLHLAGRIGSGGADKGGIVPALVCKQSRELGRAAHPCWTLIIIEVGETEGRQANSLKLSTFNQSWQS